MRDYVCMISLTVLFILTTFQIFSDHSNFRGIIKKKSTELVCLLYNFTPPKDFNGQQEGIDFIKSTIEGLTKEGNFLQGELDDEVSTNISNNPRNDSDKSAVGTCQQLNPPRSEGTLDIYIRAC